MADGHHHLFADGKQFGVTAITLFQSETGMLPGTDVPVEQDIKQHGAKQGDDTQQGNGLKSAFVPK